MGCSYNWTTAFCQKEFQKAALMQDRQLGPFSVSRLHFMYNIGLVLARTRLIFAVARRHGQNPEVDLYHLTAFQAGTAWQREHLGRVVSVDSFTLPVLCATGIVAVSFLISLLFPVYSYLSLCSLSSVLPNSPLQPPAGGGCSGWHMHSTGALENDIP